MKFASLFLLPILLFASARAQSPCLPGDAARAAMLPLGLQNKLLAHKIAPDDFEIDAPPDVSRDVVMLRKTLDVATQAFFHCQAGDDSAPASLQAKLAVFLHTKESKREESHDQTDGTYGANLTVHIEPAADFPNSLLVVLNFGIECGDDNLLFLYTREDGQWHQRLHWYSDQYAKPSDAFGGAFSFSAVPSPSGDQPLLAVVHGHPWCTSVHSGFGLDLIRPASASSPQQVLDHVTHGYVIDDEFKVSRTNVGMKIRTSVESMDTSRIYHPGVLSFSTISGKLILLPVALNARDFVDEWLQEPWATVQNWSESATISKLQERHKAPFGGTFGPVRACKSSKDHFQVEVDSDEGASLYAQVRQNPNSFTMLSISGKPDPACTGPDLMKKPAGKSPQ